MRLACAALAAVLWLVPPGSAARAAEPCSIAPDAAAGELERLTRRIDELRAGGKPDSAAALKEAHTALAEFHVRCLDAAARAVGERFQSADGDAWWTRYLKAQGEGRLLPLPPPPGTASGGVEVDASMFTDGTGNTGKSSETLAQLCERLAPGLGQPPLSGADGLVSMVLRRIPGEGSGDPGLIAPRGFIDLEAVEKDLAH